VVKPLVQQKIYTYYITVAVKYTENLGLHTNACHCGKNRDTMAQ
jgi:hypothetical protein